ncbi:3-hydroxypropanoate dehydrogenase [Rhodocyclaceae bacterium]|nr:3-hydroxypropanoate dehydrogenase [Rhodocyclaceae bacterium]
MTTTPAIAAVDAAIESRRSVRAYLDKPVDRAEIERILQVAARAPSGTNMQPWHVHVLTGRTLDALTAAVCAAFDTEPEAHEYEYDYYPAEFFEPYLGRRRKVGFDLYKLVGIAKGDTAAMRAQHRRNFEFFGAPVGMIFTIDRRLGKGSWFDYGMFLQNVMVAARARGLDTCPQAAWAQFHRVIAAQLALPPEQMVVCGLALGYADASHVTEQLVTERAPVSDFAVFRD